MKSFAMKSFLFFIFVIISSSLGNSPNQLQGKKSVLEKINFDVNKLAKDQANSKPPTEQEKVDTIMKAFKHLPAPELDRLNIDLSHDIKAHTEEAEKLKSIWELRQRELKDIMSKLEKPVETMKKIIDVLAQFQQQKKQHFVDLQQSSMEQPASVLVSEDKVRESLLNLESLVADIDNARDFHTIGGWKVLTSFLSHRYPLSLNALAAWCIGTAIKNDYDYQLWVMEPFQDGFATEMKFDGSIATVASSEGTVFEKLLDLLIESNLRERFQSHYLENGANFFEFFLSNKTDVQRKSMYAISAALRGNIDVQTFALKLKVTPELDSHTNAPYQASCRLDSALFTLLEDNRTDISVIQKVWSMVSDALDERRYVRKEFDLKRHLLPEWQNDSLKTSLEKELSEVQEMPLLGDLFIRQEWADTLAVRSLVQYSHYLIEGTPIHQQPSQDALTSKSLRSHQSIAHSLLNVIYHSLTSQADNRSSLSSPNQRAAIQVTGELIKRFQSLSHYEDFVSLAKLVHEMLN